MIKLASVYFLRFTSGLTNTKVKTIINEKKDARAFFYTVFNKIIIKINLQKIVSLFYLATAEATLSLSRQVLRTALKTIAKGTAKILFIDRIRIDKT